MQLNIGTYHINPLSPLPSVMFMYDTYTRGTGDSPAPRRARAKKAPLGVNFGITGYTNRNPSNVKIIFFVFGKNIDYNLIATLKGGC